MSTPRQQIHLGLGVLVLAAALSLPLLARPRAAGPFGETGPGWMTGGRGAVQGSGPVGSIDAAASVAKDALASYGLPDLVVAEVMEFSNHFYVLVKEQATGRGALELIVERTGAVHGEPGPSMMWNTKYGHMRAGSRGYGPRRMRGGSVVPPSGAELGADDARELAVRYLAQTIPGSTPDEGTAFYGYVTFDVERSGDPVGMLSVNTYTGQVWYHTWHGTFVTEREF
jgi:hypothetical protein